MSTSLSAPPPARRGAARFIAAASVSFYGDWLTTVGMAHVSLDCGVMHLACAAGAPTLAIFTTTQADEWGPYGPGNHILRAHGLPPAAIARELAALIDALPARRLPPG